MSDADTLADFQVRSHDHLDRLEQDLVGLERDPTSTRLLNRVLGVVRSLSAAATPLGLRRIPTLADAAETLLAQISRGRVVISCDVVDGLLTCVDAIRAVLDALAATGGEGDQDLNPIVAMLDVVAVPADPLPVARQGDPRPLGEILLTQGSLTIAQLAAALDGQTEKRCLLDGAVRVDADVLKHLQDRAVELRERRDLLQSALQEESAGPLTAAAAAGLFTLIETTQEAIRQTRLRRLDDVWMCLPRVLRDATAPVGKTCSLVTEGGAQRFDRAILGTLRDPLILLVRNAVEHGIEPTLTRQAAGKPSAGVVRVTAATSGDRLVLEVRDDGVGVDPMRVRSLALRRGLSSAYELARLSDNAALQLIRLPGLTTDFGGGAVTWVSPGAPRGFGLALATVALEAAGGMLELSSTVGVGTTVRLTLPLTVRARAAVSP